MRPTPSPPSSRRPAPTRPETGSSRSATSTASCASARAKWTRTRSDPSGLARRRGPHALLTGDDRHYEAAQQGREEAPHRREGLPAHGDRDGEGYDEHEAHDAAQADGRHEEGHDRGHEVEDQRERVVARDAHVDVVGDAV